MEIFTFTEFWIKTSLITSVLLDAISLVLVPAVGRTVSGVLASAPLAARGHHRPRRTARGNGGGSCLSGVHVGLLLGLHDILLVSDPLVPEPIANLQTMFKLNNLYHNKEQFNKYKQYTNIMGS